MRDFETKESGPTDKRESQEQKIRILNESLEQKNQDYLMNENVWDRRSGQFDK